MLWSRGFDQVSCNLFINSLRISHNFFWWYSLEPSKVHPHVPTTVHHASHLITHLVQFVLPIYSWARGHHRRMWPTSHHTLKGNWVSLPQSHQFLITAQGWRLINAFLVHARILTGLTLYRSSAANHSCCKFMSEELLSCPEDICTLLVLTPSSYRLSTLSPALLPESWGEGVM